jgi:hypothetical protein
MMNLKSLAIIKNNPCAVIACVCVIAGADVSAAIVTPTASVTVTKSLAYTTFDGGDFVFSTSVNAPGCTSGWYISSTDPGYKTAVAVVVTAQAAGNYLTVFGDNSQLWPGSTSGQYCHVWTVGIAS